MSKEDALFSPRAMCRVVNHVEWEPEVAYYKDGTSNQQWYVQAMVMLLERWLREFSLPDLAVALHAAGGGDWPGLIQQGLETIESKVQHLRGFYEGLWYGANPRAVIPDPASLPLGPAWWAQLFPAPPPDDSPEARLLGHLSKFFQRLRELSEPMEQPVEEKKEAARG